jgi:hypothetical protein
MKRQQNSVSIEDFHDVRPVFDSEAVFLFEISTGVTIHPITETSWTRPSMLHTSAMYLGSGMPVKALLLKWPRALFVLTAYGFLRTSQRHLPQSGYFARELSKKVFFGGAEAGGNCRYFDQNLMRLEIEGKKTENNECEVESLES